MIGNIARGLGMNFPNTLQYLLSPRCFSDILINKKCLIHNQKLYENLNIPPRPKRPLPPYFKFIQQVRPTINKEFPDIKQTELVKVAAQRWKDVDSSLKEKLTRQYVEELATYNKLKSTYEQKLTLEQKKLINDAEMSIYELKQERKVKKKSKDLGKPKPPPGIFIKYLMSKQSEKNKYPSSKDWIKAVSQEWKTVSAEEKAKIENERKHEVDTFNKELYLWEQKMIKDGNVDIVRKASLLPQPKTKLKK